MSVFETFLSDKSIELYPAQKHVAEVLITAIANDETAREYFEGWRTGKTLLCELIGKYFESVKVRKTDDLIAPNDSGDASHDAV